MSMLTNALSLSSKLLNGQDSKGPGCNRTLWKRKSKASRTTPPG